MAVLWDGGNAAHGAVAAMPVVVEPHSTDIGGNALSSTRPGAPHRPKTSWRPVSTAPGLSVTGLRLADGSLVLKLEGGGAAVQFRVEASGGFGPSDGVLAQHDLLAEPRAFVTRLRAAHALALGEILRWVGGRGTATC